MDYLQDGDFEIMQKKTMKLRDLELTPVLDTSSSDIIAELFVPALRCSTRYDRGVGYFSSGWLRIAAKGMVEFAKNGGKARWVTSPILSEKDWKALQEGDAARTDELLKSILDEQVADLRRALEEKTLSALAWMVAEEVIVFKLALPRNKLSGGEFHDKFGVFEDAEGNRVSFNGSYNDSIKGIINYESLKVFSSWHEFGKVHVEADELRFERLWNGTDPNVQVYDLPESAKKKIVKLRKEERAYPKPKPALAALLEDIMTIRPSIPADITLRDYQEEAIQSWFENKNNGILEMATGTGKTITALGGATRLYEELGRLAIVIAVPFQHLVDQWNEDARKFGFSPVLAYQSRKTWTDKLHERTLAFNHEDTNNLCVIVTHTTFSTDHFHEAIGNIKEPVLFIADEVHHLGAENSRSYLPDQIRHRLGLSATPDRWLDDIGTAEIRTYFGKTVFELPLSDAIGLSLTPYYYYPVLVELTNGEIEKYRGLSIRIARLLANKTLKNAEEELTMLLIKRAEILNAAENKIPELGKLIDQTQEIHHTLFYSSPSLIDEVVHLLGWEKRIAIHRFTAEESAGTRRKLLADFDSGKLQALAAMRCLDEGVDVPSTRTAYILASSSNPRQFIQRRGRVLRKAEGKEHAIIYDLITVPPPPSYLSPEARGAEQSILRKELRRFAEFADSALNTQSAYEVIWELAREYGVLDF